MEEKVGKEFLKNFIKKNIEKFGFDKVGFSKCERIDSEFALKFVSSVENPNYNVLSYLKKNLEIRLNPKFLFPEGKTIISFATNYYRKLPENLIFSKYLTTIDYHIVLRKRMEDFIEFLKNEIGDFNYKICVDTSPILEKYWAYKSGIGWIGKNSLLVTKEFGSFVFLSEIIVDFEIEEDKICENLCFECNNCIENCPTKAIEKERKIDIRKCISYLTIEKRKKLTKNEKEMLKKGKYVFGCDICQDVCPYNKNIKEKDDKEITFPSTLIEKDNTFYLTIDENEYKKIFGNTALSRVPYNVFVDNLRVYLNK